VKKKVVERENINHSSVYPLQSGWKIRASKEEMK
jgi:hypothetical protein